MTLAEKVQLVTGIIDISAAIVGYFLFSWYYKKINKAFLIPILKFVAIGSACIGGHQVFEYLSLISGSNIIYKIGLIISISGMLFFLISLEKLYNRDFYSRYLKYLIALLALYLFSRPVEFSTLKFHLEHHSVIAWSFLWFVFFVYWLALIVFELRKVVEHISKRVAILYMLCSMTLSFLIAAAYSVWAYSSEGVNICTSYPSVWCTFGVIQMIFSPLFFVILAKDTKSLPRKSKLAIKDFFLYLIIVSMITVATMYLLAMTSCLSWEFIIS